MTNILVTKNKIIMCYSKIDKSTSTSCEVYPLPHMYIVKDLVPDLNNFYDQYRNIQPWLQRKDTKETGNQQYLQSVEDRKKLVSVRLYLFSVSITIIFL